MLGSVSGSSETRYQQCICSLLNLLTLTTHTATGLRNSKRSEVSTQQSALHCIVRSSVEFQEMAGRQAGSDE